MDFKAGFEGSWSDDVFNFENFEAPNLRIRTLQKLWARWVSGVALRLPHSLPHNISAKLADENLLRLTRKHGASTIHHPLVPLENKFRKKKKKTAHMRVA
jgi:hypothetical protein